MYSVHVQMSLALRPEVAGFSLYGERAGSGGRVALHMVLSVKVIKIRVKLEVHATGR